MIPINIILLILSLCLAAIGGLLIWFGYRLSNMDYTIEKIMFRNFERDSEIIRLTAEKAKEEREKLDQQKKKRIKQIYHKARQRGYRIDMVGYEEGGTKMSLEETEIIPEYIDREEAIKEAVAALHQVTQFQAMDVVQALEDIPAADVKQIKHGYWIHSKTHYDMDECNCSLCGQLVTTAHEVRTYYCPNCGAKMDLGE